MKFFFTKSLVAIVGFHLLFTVALAQEAIIEFNHIEFDFGQIKEEKGLANHEFKFTNKGKTPLIIAEVKTSCGCTTPFYTKAAVAPGKSGIIKAQFDPANRPGVFEKTLTVITNTSPAQTFLKIKGFVIARVKTVVDLYPDTLGNLRIESRYMNMGAVTTKEPVTKSFNIYNDGTTVIKFQNPLNLPTHIKFEMPTKTLNPKESGSITITYNAKVKQDFGYLFDNFVLPTSDTKNPNKELNVVAVVSQDFSDLTPEQRINAPMALVSKVTEELGDVAAGQIKEIDFSIINTGKMDLEIKKIKSTCDCITATASSKIAKSGETIIIKAVYDTSKRKGQEYKNIYLYTNSYKNQEIVLNIKANVVVE